MRFAALRSGFGVFSWGWFGGAFAFSLCHLFFERFVLFHACYAANRGLGCSTPNKIVDVLVSKSDFCPRGEVARMFVDLAFGVDEFVAFALEYLGEIGCEK